MCIACVYGRHPAMEKSCVAKQYSASGILTHPHCFFRECIAIQKSRTYHPAQVSQAQSWVIRTPRKTALSSITHSVPSAQIRRYKRV